MATWIILLFISVACIAATNVVGDRKCNYVYKKYDLFAPGMFEEDEWNVLAPDICQRTSKYTESEWIDFSFMYQCTDGSMTYLEWENNQFCAGNTTYVDPQYNATEYDCSGETCYAQLVTHCSNTTCDDGYVSKNFSYALGICFQGDDPTKSYWASCYKNYRNETWYSTTEMRGSSNCTYVGETTGGSGVESRCAEPLNLGSGDIVCVKDIICVVPTEQPTIDPTSYPTPDPLILVPTPINGISVSNRPTIGFGAIYVMLSMFK